MTPRLVAGLTLAMILAVAGGFAVWTVSVVRAPRSAEQARLDAAKRVLYHRVRAEDGPTFRLRGGEQRIKIITHALGPAGRGAPVIPADRQLRYGLSLVLTGPDGVERMRTSLNTVSRHSVDISRGAPWARQNAFLLGAPRVVYDDRILYFDLPEAVAPESRLALRLLGQADEAVVRLYAREEGEAAGRVALDWLLAATAARVGPAPIAADWRWGRRGADGATIEVYYTGFRTPFEATEAQRRLTLEAHHPRVVNVRGPARLELRVWRGVAADVVERAAETTETLEITDVTAAHASVSLSVPLPAGADQFGVHGVDIPDGVHSLTLSTAAAVGARVRLQGPSDQALLFGDVPELTEDGRTLVLPDDRRVPVFLVGTGGPALVYPLEPGTDEARLLKVEARRVARVSPPPGAEPRALPPGRLRLEFRDAGGQVLLADEAELPEERAAYDRLLDSAAGLRDVGEPARLQANAPAGATELVVAASGPASVRTFAYFAAPAGLKRLAPPYDVVPDTDFRWRFAPLLHHDWHTLLPANRIALRAAGADGLLAGQVRLERLPEVEAVEGPGAVFTPMVPAGRPIRRLVLEPVDDAGQGWTPGSLSALRPGRAVSVLRSFARGGPRLRTLVTGNPAAALGRTLTVFADGVAVDSTTIASVGAIHRLRGVPEGTRRLEIRPDRPIRGVRLFVDRPVPGARVWRARRLYAIGRSGLRLSARVGRADDGTIINAVLYVRGAAARPDLQLVATIDGGRPQRRVLVTPRRLTPAQRRWPVPAAEGQPPTGADGLGVGAPRRVAFRLGPDLRPGVHRVNVRLEGAETAWIRFFSARAGRRARPAPRTWVAEPGGFEP